MYTAERLVREPNCFKVEVAVGKLKRYKSPSGDEVATELIEAEGNTLRSEIHKLRGISLLPSAHNILSNILLSRLNSYVDIIGYRRNCTFGLYPSSGVSKN
jgi:hypothetical protein